MIEDVDQLEDGAELTAEVAVVGGGFAGLDLARQLGREGVRVVVLETGRMEFDPAIQELARVISVGKPLRTPSPDSPFNPYLPPQYRGEVRVRQFGGTSNIWTGKWRTFDDLDFSARDWIPFSGWPITREELLPYYRRVARSYGVRPFEEFEADTRVQRARQRLGADGLKLSVHYWASSAARPSQDFRDELEHSASVRVVLGATATEVVLDDDDLESVAAIRFRSLDGRDFSVTADRFVLATGGLEVSRLLLASNRQRPAGVGNEHGLVGRFHQDHPKTKKARLHPGPAMELIEPWTHTDPRPCFHVSLSLADETQREERVLDHAIYLSPVYRYQLDYPEEAVDQLKRALRERRPTAAMTSLAALATSPRSLWKVAQRVRHRDRGGPIAYYKAAMYVEQAPNPESRLLLADERDAIGMPKLVVDWQLNDLDRRSFGQTMASLAERLARAGIGTLDFGPGGPDLDDWTDAAHHIGATRMAASPDAGVVDGDCRVFGTANLYVASCSVFPTGHSAAPTMTILALARRLGDHLLALRGSSSQPRVSA